MTRAARSREVMIWIWFCGLFALWHLPGPYAWALRNQAIHVLEHAAFLLSAFAFWSVVIEPLGLAGRLVRSLGILVACWGAAIVSIFIPVAHFFLVPGFLVLGVVLAVARGRERERILRLHGICPRCRREREFIQSGRQGGTLWVSCPGCFNRLSVTIEGSASRTTPAAAGPLTSLGTGR